MRLSVVVLTWNSSAHVERALVSLARELESAPGEVIVIDNGSTDQSVSITKTVMPQAHLIQNAVNRGVARARNQGLEAATGEYVLFLDSDAELKTGSLREMLAFMAGHPRAGIIGPKLISPDGAVQYSCRRFPTLPGKILRQLPASVRPARWLADEEMRDLDRTVAHPVDYVIGACQLIRRTALEAIGRLDERMFYGPEDVDFCLRAWRAGWEVYYVPSAVVVHHEQRVTLRRPSLLTLRHGVALGYYFWKHRYIWRRPSRTSRPGETRR